MKSRYGHFFFILVILLFITACSQAASPSPTQLLVDNNPQTTNEVAEEPYPPPVEELPTAPAISLAYPEPGSAVINENAPYPEPGGAHGDPAITPFRLNKPIVAGVTEVSGSGPTGVPIMIVDTTLMGIILGQGIIGEDGKFVIVVPTLEKNHRIGIALDNLDGTRWSTTDFTDDYAGDEALISPMVGAFYDSALVQP